MKQVFIYDKLVKFDKFLTHTVQMKQVFIYDKLVKFDKFLTHTVQMKRGCIEVCWSKMISS